MTEISQSILETAKQAAGHAALRLFEKKPHSNESLLKQVPTVVTFFVDKLRAPATDEAEIRKFAAKRFMEKTRDELNEATTWKRFKAIWKTISTPEKPQTVELIQSDPKLGEKKGNAQLLSIPESMGIAQTEADKSHPHRPYPRIRYQVLPETSYFLRTPDTVIIERSSYNKKEIAQILGGRHEYLSPAFRLDEERKGITILMPVSNTQIIEMNESQYMQLFQACDLAIESKN